MNLNEAALTLRAKLAVFLTRAEMALTEWEQASGTLSDPVAQQEVRNGLTIHRAGLQQQRSILQERLNLTVEELAEMIAAVSEVVGAANTFYGMSRALAAA